MPGFLIPLLIASVVLVPLGILLWMGARERRRLSTMRAGDFGDLNLFKTHWETAAPKRFEEQTFFVSGVGRSTGPTATQKRTLDFVKANANELASLAIAAVRAAAADLQLADLRVTAIFLHEDPNSFELSVDSESGTAAMPDGVAVSFTGKQINEVEFVH
jgi:hypothetical protein